MIVIPERSEGPGFLPAPRILPAQAGTQVPRVRDDNLRAEMDLGYARREAERLRLIPLSR
jgi:hypothetical protein